MPIIIRAVVIFNFYRQITIEDVRLQDSPKYMVFGMSDINPSSTNISLTVHSTSHNTPQDISGHYIVQNTSQTLIHHTHTQFNHIHTSIYNQ